MKGWTVIDATAIRRHDVLSRLIANDVADPDERAEFERLTDSIARKRFRILDQIDDARRRVQQHEATARLLGIDLSPRSGNPDKRAAAPSGDGVPQFAPSPTLSEHRR